MLTLFLKLSTLLLASSSGRVRVIIAFGDSSAKLSIDSSPKRLSASTESRLNPKLPTLDRKASRVCQ